MKTLILAAISILASVQLSSADLFGAFVGTWTQEGATPGSKVTTVYKRYQTRGLFSTTTVIIPGKDKQIGVTRYYDNGRVKGDLRRNGVVQSKLAGTWLISGRSLKTKLTVTAPMVPVFSGNIRSTLVGNSNINTVSISDNGARSMSTMIRKN